MDECAGCGQPLGDCDVEGCCDKWLNFVQRFPNLAFSLGLRPCPTAAAFGRDDHYAALLGL